MDYKFLIDLQDQAMVFVEVIGNFLNTSVADLLGSWSLGILGDFANTTILSLMLSTGLLAILGYNLAKWAIPFLD